MNKPKKRNKKHNLAKRHKMATIRALRNLAVIKADCMALAEFVDTRNGKRVPVGRTLAYGATENYLKWVLIVFSYGVDSNGRFYFKSEEITTPNEYKIGELTEVYEKSKERVKSNFNPQHFKGSGFACWLAGNEFSDDVLANFLTGRICSVAA